MFLRVQITFIHCIWIKFTINTNWIGGIFTIITSINCDSKQCSNSYVVMCFTLFRTFIHFIWIKFTNEAHYVWSILGLSLFHRDSFNSCFCRRRRPSKFLSTLAFWSRFLSDVWSLLISSESWGFRQALFISKIIGLICPHMKAKR
jgi:hypothetical protein